MCKICTNLIHCGDCRKSLALTHKLLSPFMIPDVAQYVIEFIINMAEEVFLFNTELDETVDVDSDPALSYCILMGSSCSPYRPHQRYSRVYGSTYMYTDTLYYPAEAVSFYVRQGCYCRHNFMLRNCVADVKVVTHGINEYGEWCLLIGTVTNPEAITVSMENFLICNVSDGEESYNNNVLLNVYVAPRVGLSYSASRVRYCDFNNDTSWVTYDVKCKRKRYTAYDIDMGAHLIV